MASWNIPALINKISEDVPAIKALLTALFKWTDADTTDVPVGAKRLQVVTGGRQMQEYSGSAWGNVGKLMHDVDMLDGKHASTAQTADTIPVRDANGTIPGNVSGNAATATTAYGLAGDFVVPVANGGTGATTEAGARASLGTDNASNISSGILDIAYGGTGSSTKNFVDLTENQNVGGTKTFSSEIKSTAETFISGVMTGVSVADTNRGQVSKKILCRVDDKDGVRIFGIEPQAATDGTRHIFFNSRNRADSGWIDWFELLELVDGTVQVKTKTPPATANDTQIATTNWVRTASGNTSLNAATSSACSGNAATATKIQRNPGIGSYVGSAKAGGALVNLTTTNFDAIWNAPTKNYRVACATYPQNGDIVYLAYSITNANINSSTNTVAKQLTWNANDGTLTANKFSGPLTGNVTGNCSGNAANVTGTVAIAHGGTGATTLANARKALFGENMSTTNSTNFAMIGDNWEHCGYLSISEAKTVLGLKSAAYTESSAYAASNHSHSAATQSAAGFISAADKKKLDGIAAGANAYTHPTTAGNKHVPSGGSSGQFLGWSAAGTAKWVNNPNTNTTYGVFGENYNGLVPGVTSYQKQMDFILTANGKWRSDYQSDRRVKQDFENIPEELIDIWGEVRWHQFLFKDEAKVSGENAKIHAGLVVQDLHELYEKHGIDIKKYAFTLHDLREAVPAVYDDGGILVCAEQEAVDVWCLKYHEVLAFEALYLRKKIRLLEERLARVESKVN